MRRAVLLVAFILLFHTANPAYAKVTRLRFKRGTTVAIAKGRLRNVRETVFFILKAKAGQHMRVTIAGKGATRGVVIFPSGKQDGQPGGLIFDGNLDETGDYRIRVTESQMAESWKGIFTITVEIK
jgi:hypothetical protein